MLPLGDLIRDLDVRLVAGEAGLENAVRWVHISELEDPTPWLSGGELLLTTGMGCSTPTASASSSSCWPGTGCRGSGSAPASRTRRCPRRCARRPRELGFPLFEVPYEVPFIAVTEKAVSHLVNEHYAVLQRALSAHERLERIVLSEKGLDGVAEALASLIGGPALIFDARGGDERPPHRQAAVRRHRRGAAGGAARPHPRRRRAAATRPAASSRAARSRCPWCDAAERHRQPGDLPHAWLVAAKDGGALTEFDRLTLHQAVTIVALELLRRRVADDTERRLAGDLLTALVSGELAGPDLARRLEPFGLGDRVGVLVPRRRARLKADVEEALTTAVRDEAPGGLAAGTGRFSCALLPHGRGPRTRRSGSPSGSARAWRGGRGRAAGGRGPRLPRRASCGGRSTRRAARWRRGRWPATTAQRRRPAAAAGDLPRPRLLPAPALAAGRRRAAAVLRLDPRPIEEGEGAYGGELMRSLESFIECNGQWEKAARQLYCHRHTLRYRIRRVEELTGRSLDSARDRIDFWLALRGRELIT